MDCFVLLRNSLFLDKLIILVSFFHYQYWEITMVLSMGKTGEGSDLSLWWTTDGRTCRMGEGGAKLLCYWMSRWELQRWFYISIDCYQSSSQVAWLCSWTSVLCRNLGFLLSRLQGELVLHVPFSGKSFQTVLEYILEIFLSWIFEDFFI